MRHTREHSLNLSTARLANDLEQAHGTEYEHVLPSSKPPKAMSQSDSTSREGETLYPLHHATDKPEESERLDNMHEGIKEYLGGSLSVVRLEDTAPTKILELGCGSGAWAIQAAKQFPSAKVIAVDLASIPSRDLPPNLEFRKLDITKPFPFEPEIFDIVHMRFVALHLPRFEDVLNQIISVVRPGGWLLLEDVDNVLHDDGGLGPGQKTFWEAYHSQQKEKDVNPLAGSSFEGLLKASDSFRNVNIQKIKIPFSNSPNDTRIGRLGNALRKSLQGAIRNLLQSPDTFGITSDIVKQFSDEMSDPNRALYINLYFTWSCKLS